MEVFDAAELWSRDQIEHTQLTRLKATVAHVRKSEFYRRRLDEAGVTPESITSLDDIRRIPFTTKQDLRDQYPTGLLCVPRSEIVRMHCSSGTTGSPVAICHTQNDINCWADLMARCLYMVGVRRDDVFQNMSGYGLFTGGPGIHFGAERLGCMTIPAGPGNSRRQIKLAKDFKTTVAHILPSYALILGEHLRNMGEDPRDFPLRIAVVGAEPYTVEFRRRIEELFDMKAYNSYGLSEMNGPGVAFECSAQAGMHINEDHFIAEIIDPETGEVLPDGQQGELVFTSITKEAFPLLRYRTRDICVLSHEKCSCGRTHVKMTKPRGRTDDMLIIRGVNVFPSQIETVLLNHGYPANYQIIVDRVRSTDTLDVQVEMTPEMFTDNMGEIERRQKELVDGLRSMLGLAAKVTLVAPKSIVRSEGKDYVMKDGDIVLFRFNV